MSSGGTKVRTPYFVLKGDRLSTSILKIWTDFNSLYCLNKTDKFSSLGRQKVHTVYARNTFLYKIINFLLYAFYFNEEQGPTWRLSWIHNKLFLNRFCLDFFSKLVELAYKDSL